MLFDNMYLFGHVLDASQQDTQHMLFFDSMDDVAASGWESS